MLLFLLLMFQGSEPLTFEPIYPGNDVQFGSFSIKVPEKLFLSSEADAVFMLPLTGASHIPNCGGIFFSNSEDWSFCGIIQFFPYLTYSYEPMPEPDYFLRAFQRTHLYYLSEAEGPVKTVIPPTYDPGEGSFVLGMDYSQPKEKSGVFIKKTWLNAQDSLVILIKVTSRESYERNMEAIDSMLASVTPAQTQLEGLPTQPSSFLTLFGLANMSGQVQNEPLPIGVIISSVVLFSVGILLIFFAMRLRKKNEKASQAAQAQTDEAQTQTDEIQTQTDPDIDEPESNPQVSG